MEEPATKVQTDRDKETNLFLIHLTGDTPNWTLPSESLVFLFALASSSLSVVCAALLFCCLWPVLRCLHQYMVTSEGSYGGPTQARSASGIDVCVLPAVSKGIDWGMEWEVWHNNS